MVLYTWLAVKDQEKISHKFIKLENDKTIVWGHDTVPCGRWRYIFTTGDGGMMLLESAASKSRYKRKHVLRQLTDDAFVLLPVAKADFVYNDPLL